jgi:rhodanese-related sulfurtransferase
MQKAITKQQVQEIPVDKIKLIDIRSLEEYQRLHIPGVVNIPSENLAGQLAELNKEDTIVCVCNYGKERSQQAAGFLFDAGFKNTFYLQGGTAGWYD